MTPVYFLKRKPVDAATYFAAMKKLTASDIEACYKNSMVGAARVIAGQNAKASSKSEFPILDGLVAEFNAQNSIKTLPVGKASTQAKPPIHRAGTAKPTASSPALIPTRNLTGLDRVIAAFKNQKSNRK